MKACLKSIVVIASSVVTVLAEPFLASAQTVNLKGVRQISQDVATGNSKEEIPKIELSPGYGVNISFIKSGEVVEKVWLDNPAIASLDVDGCLSGLGRPCETPGATVLHLRRINPLKVPQLPKINSSLLTVVAKGNSGRQVYVFRVAMGDATPEYHTIEVIPKPEEPETIILRGATNITNLQVMARGLEAAQQQRLISPGSRLWRRLENFLVNIKAGESIENAAQQSGISLQLVNRLIQLGQNRQLDNFKQRVINN
ncbi:hypothetical protein DSM106972_094370 [Dulcicalothrix desertica PCC 7102]|uniref:Uncharacterized protein n=1 Tax=Dulcicalothrix desertica PCC 7102 TaxID=232991 RepID=A0A3S1I9W0_9CYAN|nr:hypothetical protein [Dulcicalothrix desertica]RUS94178.1 hypothetical protein DSM106972_094370 [Dulcicalothrix desertica PCC 7102]